MDAEQSSAFLGRFQDSAAAVPWIEPFVQVMLFLILFLFKWFDLITAIGGGERL